MGDLTGILESIRTSVTTNELMKKYKGSQKEKEMQTIFNYLDGIDDYTTSDSFGQQDGIITGKLYGMIFYNIKEFLLDDNGEISLEKAKKIFGEDVDINDIETAIKDVAELSDEKSRSKHKKLSEEKKQKFSDIPEAVRREIDLNDNVEVIEKNGEKFYLCKMNGDESNIVVYNSKGERVSEKTEVEHDGEKATQTLTFEQGKITTEMLKIESGRNEKYDYNNNRAEIEFGKNKFEYNIGKTGLELDKIKFNEGLINEVSMKCEYDENGNIKDITIEPKPQKASIGDFRDVTIKSPPANMSKEQKQNLIDILNNGAKLGKDFELNFNGNDVEINPLIKDNDGNYISNMPDSFRQDVINAMKNGLHLDEDYSLSREEDGSFKMDLQSQKAREYSCDEKIIKYSPDGSTKFTLTTDGDTITTTIVDKNFVTTSTIDRSGKLLELLLNGKFNDANDLLGDIDYQTNNFDFYAVCKKYQDLSGKNLMEQLINKYKAGEVKIDIIKRLTPTIGWGILEDIEKYNYGVKAKDENNLPFNVQEEYDNNIEMYTKINNYNPQTSQVKDLLPQIGTKNIVSENKYTQKINEKLYTVEKSQDKIKITLDGQTKYIDVKGLHANLQKFIFEANPRALFDIAKKQTVLQIAADTKSNGNGLYIPSSNTLALNSERMSKKIFVRTLVHETGHSFYNTTEYTKNIALVESFKREKALWENSQEKFKTSDHTCCTENIDEFFAEAYCLLITGRAKSEYTICEYFSKTLKIVKQMIENQ